MGVIHNTDTTFEASIRSYLTGVILLVLGLTFSAIGIAALGEGEPQGGIFVAVGLGLTGLAVWILHRRTRLRLDKTENSAQITVSSLLGSTLIDLPLTSVTRARVLKRRSSGKRQYMLVLQVDEGEHAGNYSLTGGYSSGGWPKGRMARAINGWLGVDDPD